MARFYERNRIATFIEKTGTLLAVLVLIVDQFVGRSGCPLERQKQDSHVYGKLAHCQPFLVLTVDQFFGRGGLPT